jgi:hypothetical protein
MRQAFLGWIALAVLASVVRLPRPLGALILVPFLLVAPGVILARLVSPDDRRFRWPIAVAAGFAVLALVSGGLAIAGRFGLVAVVVMLAGVCVVTMTRVSEPISRVPILPARPITHGPRSVPAVRFQTQRASVWLRGPSDETPLDRGATRVDDRFEAELQAALDAQLLREADEHVQSVAAPSAQPADHRPLYVPTGWQGSVGRQAPVDWQAPAATWTLADLVSSPTLAEPLRGRNAAS